MKVVAFDTETKGLDWWGGQTAFLVTWSDGEGSYYADVDDPDGIDAFLDDLRDADLIVCHNAPFDIHQVRETLGFDVLTEAGTSRVIDPLTGKPWGEYDLSYVNGRRWCPPAPVHDTDVMSRVLHPEGQRKGARGGHGLKNLATVYLREDAKDPEDHIKEMAKAIGLKTIKRASAYYDVYRAFPDPMIEYALADADFTYRLHEVFEKEVRQRDDKAPQVLALEHAVQPILIRAEQRGMQTDQAQVASFATQFRGERAVLLERLDEAGIPEKALGGEGSEDLLRESLLAAGVPLTEKTPTGQLSTSHNALAALEDDHPVVADLFSFRRVERFLNTYIGPCEGVDVIHPSFIQCGAWTGRMSCRRPNMQNWPQRAGKEVRNCLRARDGYKLVITDYATLEARLLAYYLGDPVLRQQIDDGLDMNSWMAAQIWGGEVDDWRKDGPLAEGERSRKTARHTLYAVIYGAGARRVTKQLPFLDPGPWLEADHPRVLAAREAGRYWPQPGWQYDEARSLINKVKSSLPNWWHLQHRLGQKIDSVGYVNTIYGRKNPVGRDKKYMATSALIQGSGADIMKLGLVKACKAIAPLGGHPLLVVHDELVSEVPERHAEEALALQTAALEAAIDISPHLKVSGAIVDRYGED